MKDLLILLAHLLTTIAKLLGPGGTRAIVADSLLMKQQLLVINHSRQRAPNLSALDRFLFGFWSLFLDPRRLWRSAVIIRPSTLLKFHDMLKKRKYRLLYSFSRKGKPGPKGPSRELIQAIVELKQRNPRFGCRRIAQQIAKAFGVDIDKYLVRRVVPTKNLISVEIIDLFSPFPVAWPYENGPTSSSRHAFLQLSEPHPPAPRNPRASPTTGYGKPNAW